MTKGLYLTQEVAKQLDVELMTTFRYSLDQLMELAGLSVASAIYEEYPPNDSVDRRIYIVCGPGNNGGDGLVAARHLKHFGYKPTCVIPKPSTKDFYQNLMTQVRNLEIPIQSCIDDVVSTVPIVDAVFGFGFDSKSIIKPPFDNVLKTMESMTDCPKISVDVPSGWDVDLGNVGSPLSAPAMLISLTAPKAFAKTLDDNVVHYLGGRGFIPQKLQARFSIEGLPEFPRASQCVRISKGKQI